MLIEVCTLLRSCWLLMSLSFRCVYIVTISHVHLFVAIVSLLRSNLFIVVLIQKHWLLTAGRCQWERSCCSSLTRYLSHATSSRRLNTSTSREQWRKCRIHGLYWTLNCAVSSELWQLTFLHLQLTGSGKEPLSCLCSTLWFLYLSR